MLSRLVINESTILMYNPLSHEIYHEQYVRDDNFKELYDALNHDNHQLGYYMHDILLYHLEKLCLPRDERVNVIREAHTFSSLVISGLVRHLHSDKCIVIGLG
jgi:hypothetical protein